MTLVEKFTEQTERVREVGNSAENIQDKQLKKQTKNMNDSNDNHIQLEKVWCKYVSGWMADKQRETDGA